MLLHFLLAFQLDVFARVIIIIIIIIIIFTIFAV